MSYDKCQPYLQTAVLEGNFKLKLFGDQTINPGGDGYLKGSYDMINIHIPKYKIINIWPFGRFAIVFDKEGGAWRYPGGLEFRTNLSASLFRQGDYQGTQDLGSGLVTNVGVLGLANDFAWTATNALNSLFAKMKYFASGTGTNPAAATDIKLQTPSTFGGQTPSGISVTQSLISAANLQKYQTVGTIAYTGTEAVTEWGIFSYDSDLPTTANLSDNSKSPFTAGSATTGTITGTMTNASDTTHMGQQMSIAENTGNATPHWGLITANTTTVLTVPAWYKVSDGTAAGTFPANTNTFVFRPIMWDHKQFSAINVNSGDSIQFTYQLTISSGG